MTPLKACKPLQLAILLGSFLFTAQAFAQSDDPGFIGALGIEDPSVSNSYYFETSFDNDFSRRHWVYFYGEDILQLSKDWGVVTQFPNLETRYPLGQFPLLLEPVGIFARYVAWHFGGWNDETAGAFSLQAGGSYGFHNTSAPWIGSSWTLEAIGGYRMGRVFLQADYEYQGAIDPQVRSQWQFNQSLGYRLTTEWFVQVEADISATASFDDVSWTYTPQIAFQPGDWLFEFGEDIEAPAGYTEIMVARAL